MKQRRENLESTVDNDSYGGADTGNGIYDVQHCEPGIADV